MHTASTNNNVSLPFALHCAANEAHHTLQACKRLLQNYKKSLPLTGNSPSPPTFPFRLDQHSHYPAISSCRKACTEPRPLIGQGSGLATLLFAALTGNGVSVFQLAFLFPGRPAPETSHTKYCTVHSPTKLRLLHFPTAITPFRH